MFQLNLIFEECVRKTKFDCNLIVLFLQNLFPRGKRIGWHSLWRDLPNFLSKSQSKLNFPRKISKVKKDKSREQFIEFFYNVAFLCFIARNLRVLETREAGFCVRFEFLRYTCSLFPIRFSPNRPQSSFNLSLAFLFG